MGWTPNRFPTSCGAGHEKERSKLARALEELELDARKLDTR